MYKCESAHLLAGAQMPTVEQYLCYAQDFHKQGVYGQGITVGIVDSGADLSDPATKEAVTGGVSLVTGDKSVQDKIRHGSLVAKIILTIAPQAKIVPVRIFGENGECEDETAGKGLQVSAEKADITNASIGGPDHEEIRKAIAMHKKAKKPLIAAAGNHGDGDEKTNEFAYPAADDYVTAIGAVDMGIADLLRTTAPLKPSKYSVSNPFVDGVALGRIPDVFSEGTSFAAPVVTALLALYMSWAKMTGRPYDDDACYAWLLGHTRQLPGYEAKNNQTGYGFVTLRPHQERHVLEVHARTGEAWLDGKQYQWQHPVSNINGRIVGWQREFADAMGMATVFDERKWTARYTS